MKYKYTCKEAAEVIVASQDRPLRWPERLLLRLHLMVCDACPRLVAQMAFLRRAMRQFRL